MGGALRTPALLGVLVLLGCCMLTTRGIVTRRGAGKRAIQPPPLPGGLSKRRGALKGVLKARQRVGDPPAEAEGGDDVASEFGCAVCLNLVYMPVVLPCGHLFCFWCCNKSMDVLGAHQGGNRSALLSSAGSRCPICRFPFRNFPRTCKPLHSFLERTYPAAYARRREEAAEEEASMGITAANATAWPCAGDRPRQETGDVHVGVGCDLCGEMPIVGRRFKCHDCKGPVGFDMCEACSEDPPANLAGRFGQAHNHTTHNVCLVPQDALSRAVDVLRRPAEGGGAGADDGPGSGKG